MDLHIDAVFGELMLPTAE